MSPADKKYNLTKHKKILFWTFLFQIAVSSAMLFSMSLGVITGWAYHMGTAFSREPWLWYSILAGSSILFIVSVIAILQYRGNKDTWVDWAIGIGGVLSVLFIIETVVKARKGIWFANFGFRYDIFMVTVNIAYLAFLFRYKANAKIAREKTEKGGQLCCSVKRNRIRNTKKACLQ